MDDNTSFLSFSLQKKGVGEKQSSVHGSGVEGDAAGDVVGDVLAVDEVARVVDEGDEVHDLVVPVVEHDGGVLGAAKADDAGRAVDARVDGTSLVDSR